MCCNPAALLADAAESFAAQHGATSCEPNRERIAENLAKSLMLVTALNPRIGYDKAVTIGKHALAENITLKQAAAAARLRPARGFRSLGRARRR